MDNVLILESNSSDMKFLKTLPKYSQHNFFFTEDPAEALGMIEEKNIDVFVCPYEIEGFNPDDILMTANFTTNHPLVILTSDAEDIPGLLTCINTYSVYRMVIKPFMNILDIKAAIDEAVNRRAAVGSSGDDMLSLMLSDSKETDFWMNHDRMIDYRYLKVYLGLFMGIRFKKVDDQTNNEHFLVEMLVQDVWDQYMRSCVLAVPTLARIADLFSRGNSLEHNEYISFKYTGEVKEKCNNRADIMLVCLIFKEYLRHSLTEYNAEITLRYENEMVLIKMALLKKSHLIPEVLILKEEVERLLSQLTYKYSLGADENAYEGAAIIKA